ncbi:AAAP family transporter: amino acid [Micractinium conductrix]|uniref:AAAP family transporter: amino acid n=1 Tax=Micractinium conductrix TaxID=554055 RepID=A0A2P6VH69_9CHLO|nr:AAAP family transporter: amino acid [Micractinium conductrix]|eukprot:PSC73430.1 AAAP family transporter: amino acid [Micractinium conductrix]
MYSADDPVAQAARLMLAVIQVVSYPVNMHPARAAARELLRLAGWQRVRGFHTAATLLFWGGTLATALTVSGLGVVFQLVGGTCGAVLILGMPGTLLMSYAVGKWRGQQAQQAQQQQQEAQRQPPWASELWWSGLGLVLCTAALCAYTLATL